MPDKNTIARGELTLALVGMCGVVMGSAIPATLSYLEKRDRIVKEDRIEEKRIESAYMLEILKSENQKDRKEKMDFLVSVGVVTVDGESKDNSNEKVELFVKDSGAALRGLEMRLERLDEEKMTLSFNALPFSRYRVLTSTDLEKWVVSASFDAFELSRVKLVIEDQGTSEKPRFIRMEIESLFGENRDTPLGPEGYQEWLDEHMNGANKSELSTPSAPSSRTP